MKGTTPGLSGQSAEILYHGEHGDHGEATEPATSSRSYSHASRVRRAGQPQEKVGQPPFGVPTFVGLRVPIAKANSGSGRLRLEDVASGYWTLLAK